jgi:hypothetical protein
MATTRSLTNGFQLVDWSDEINNVDNQAGLIGGMNLFRTQGISQTAVVFDKSMNDTTLLPQVSRCLCLLFDSWIHYLSLKIRLSLPYSIFVRTEDY